MAECLALRADGAENCSPSQRQYKFSNAMLSVLPIVFKVLKTTTRQSALQVQRIVVPVSELLVVCYIETFSRGLLYCECLLHLAAIEESQPRWHNKDHVLEYLRRSLILCHIQEGRKGMFCPQDAFLCEELLHKCIRGFSPGFAPERLCCHGISGFGPVHSECKARKGKGQGQGRGQGCGRPNVLYSFMLHNIRISPSAIRGE